MKPKTSGKLYDWRILGASHRTILSFIKPGESVLDVGCAAGILSEPLLEQDCDVTGIEMNSIAAEDAREYCNRVIVGDIADPAIQQQIRQKYDRFIFADILEHLADPWAALSQAHGWLADNGSVIISLPNVGYRKIRFGLLFGKFNYAPYGILDETHLRFFTRATARLFIESCGFRILREQPVPTTKLRDVIGMRLLPSLFAWRFVFYSIKA